jgi:tetratricopeptide (TPR) repeat protein
MDGSYTSRFFSKTSYRNFWISVVSIAPFISGPTGPAAQEPSLQQLDRIAIHGTVRDLAGKPVSDALVRLEQENSSDAVTTTNSQGAFVFSALHAGTYLVRAEKSGLLGRATAVVSSTPDQNSVDLVLEPSHAVSSNTGASSPPFAEAMTFADKPNFTVAGMTDWTAAGGHGSDSSLRTSEALAREAVTLKPENQERIASASSVSGPVTSESVSKLRAALAKNPRSFEANHQLGEFCLHAGSYREAIPLLETAYQIDPANHSNEYDLTLAYKEAGDFSKAQGHIQKLLAYEKAADLRRLAGELDEEAGNSVAAVHEYEEAVHLDPSEPNYFRWGAELLLHRAVWPAAEVFRKGAETHPKSARMLAALGAALFASALYDEAALRLCAASDLNPAEPAPYIFLGKIDMAAPVPLACVEPKLMRFVQEQPGNARANYYYAMAIWKRQKGVESSQDMKQVESLLTNAVAADPRYDEAYLQLGNLYAVERNFNKAINFYTKAIEINPQLSEAHYKLGVAYERISKPAKAKQEFQLHDEIEKAQEADIEHQRREVKQFLVILQDQQTSTSQP